MTWLELPLSYSCIHTGTSGNGQDCMGLPTPGGAVGSYSCDNSVYRIQYILFTECADCKGMPQLLARLGGGVVWLRTLSNNCSQCTYPKESV